MAFCPEGTAEQESIAKIIAKKVKIEFDNEKTRQEKFEEEMKYWEEAETKFQCKPCTEHRDSIHRPKHLRKFNKGDFGVVKKTEQRNWNITIKMEGQRQLYGT